MVRGVSAIMKKNMNINEIRQKGLEALSKSLGPDGMIRFLQQFDSGNGDYSKERHAWLDDYTIDDVFNEIHSKTKS